MMKRLGLCFWLAVSFGEAFTPPHPNAPNRDELYTHQRHLRSEAPFHSQFINPALCAGLSEGECRNMEDGIKEHGKSIRRLVQSTGLLRILVVPIQFTDHAWRWMPDPEIYDEIFNGVGQSEHIPTGSFKDWFDFNSYGQVEIEAEIMNWTVSDNTELHYSFNRSGLTHQTHKAWYPALDLLEEQGFDFTRFDLDQDGVIDNLVLLHSGYPAEVGGLDCYNTAANLTYRIWAHATANEDHWRSQRTGIRARAYAISSGLRGRCYQRPTRISILIHEYLHTHGLPDLLDWAGDWVGKGIGNYDVMGNAHGRNGAQLHPAHLSPWSKQRLGWIEPTEIVEDGMYEIEASELSDSVYVIRKNFPDGEFLEIENRQPLLWDQLLWGGGLLIWHRDSHQSLFRWRGYPTQEGWPSNNKHYGLSIAQADGRYDMERGFNLGDDGDYWRYGMEIGPGPIDLEAQNFTGYPNTNSYSFGIIQQTGIRIYNISRSDVIMTFCVSGLSQTTSPSPPTQTAAPTQSTPAPTTSIPTFSPTKTTPAPSAAPLPKQTNPPKTLQPSSSPESPSAAPTPFVSSAIPTLLDSSSPSGVVVTASPVTASPVTASPVSASPVTSPPITAGTTAPVTLTPVAVAPVSSAPVSAPVSATPVSLAPVTASPFTVSPTSSSPVQQTDSPVSSVAPLTAAPTKETDETVSANPSAMPSLGLSLSGAQSMSSASLRRGAVTAAVCVSLTIALWL